MGARSRNLTETLREAIAESGESFRGLEQKTGVLRQCLMKFARAEQSLRLDQADKLAEYFGMELVHKKRKG